MEKYDKHFSIVCYCLITIFVNPGGEQIDNYEQFFSYLASYHHAVTLK